MERRLGLDVLKGASILLVIFNHATIWAMRSGDRLSAFAYGIAFGTVAAFSASAGYVQGLHPPREEWAILRKRAGQLLIPWALWAPLYAIAPFAWRELGGGPLPIGFSPLPWAREVLLGGGPLWFLPVLFVVTAICAYLDTRTSSWWPTWAALGAYIALVAVFAPGNTSPLALGSGTFWAITPLYVAAFWFGLRVSRDGLPQLAHSVLLLAIGVSMAASGGVTLFRAVHVDRLWLMWLPYALGAIGGCAALVLAAGRARFAMTKPLSAVAEWFARAGRTSLGLYALHPLLVAPLVLLAHGRWGVPYAALVAFVALAVGMPLVEWLRTVPILRRVV